MKKRKNPAAVILGKLGGVKKSDRKTKANRENILKRWAKHRIKNGGDL